MEVLHGNITSTYEHGYFKHLGSYFVITEGEGRISFGSDCFVGLSTLICSLEEISIGDNTIIGEFCSIRDQDHKYDNPNVPIQHQGCKTSSIKIGSNIWIGAGCRILRGSVIEDDCIIGANSVVKGHIPKGHKYVGNPLLYKLEEIRYGEY